MLKFPLRLSFGKATSESMLTLAVFSSAKVLQLYTGRTAYLGDVHANGVQTYRSFIEKRSRRISWRDTRNSCRQHKGYGYEITSADVWAAYEPTMKAAQAISEDEQVRGKISEAVRFGLAENN